MEMHPFSCPDDGTYQNRGRSHPTDGERLPLSSLSGCQRRLQPGAGVSRPRVTPLDRGAFFYPHTLPHAPIHCASVASASSTPCFDVAENPITVAACACC